MADKGREMGRHAFTHGQGSLSCALWAEPWLALQCSPCNVRPPPLWQLSMAKNFTVSVESVRSGRLWTPLTAAFSHSDGWHLAANMLGLYFFGRDVGRVFGGRRVSTACGGQSAL